ncbi:hypothetical protein THRCLA_04392 [Thraustotheca clavata]|uniref:PH domain-containing protein n=1 Tax=Thraustotheca clavata TaxID=74557 RepID=A0A1V9ZZE2_9STRA|nr:hypothetical protein THRCLA_04392 [Thraustotheca clavata]
MGTGASKSIKPFQLEEFSVEWLAFQAEITEPGARERGLASKDGLVSSKILRGRQIDEMLEEMKGLNDTFISKEYFIATLTLFYLGNTEDKIGYVFSMYGITYGLERPNDGVINYDDYMNLLELLGSKRSLPAELMNVFEDCNLSKDALLSASIFLKWVRQYPHIMEALAKLLPASLPDTENVQDVLVPLPEHVLHEDTDPLNISPSFKYSNDRRLQNASSFDMIGGDSSEDSSAGSDAEQELLDEEPAPPVQAPAPVEASPPKRPSFPREEVESIEDHFPTRSTSLTFPRTDRVKRNTMGKIGRVVGGGISKVGRSILPKGKKGAAYATATAGNSTDNHHYIGGYLHKISDGKWSKRVWHTRWFVLDLERGVLSYYKANPSAAINSPHGSVAFYDDLDLNLGSEETKSSSSSNHRHLPKPHPWFRGCMDLNQQNVSLLFEKQFAHNAPNQYFFQVSNLNIGESESKRGSQYKLCANSEDEFMQWTNAIADVINRKHNSTTNGQKGDNLTIQQKYRQKLQESMHDIHEPNDAPDASISDDHESQSIDGERESEARRSSMRISTTSTSTSPHSPQSSPTQPSPVPVPPIVPPRHYTELHPVVWHFSLTIEGKRDCLIFLSLLNFCSFTSFSSFGRAGQVFVMIFVTLLFLRCVRRPLKTPLTLVVNEDELPCAIGGTCCLHPKGVVESTPVTALPFLSTNVPLAPTMNPTNLKFQFDMLSSFKQSSNDDCAENAWSYTTANTFNVRSQDYKRLKKKEASAGALFDFVGADLIRSESKIDCITQHVKLPENLNGERLFVLNAQLPLYGPSLFGGNNYDGPGVNLVMYWTIPKDVQDQLENPTTPAIRLLKRFLNSAKEPSILERFKVIAQVVNEKDCGLSGMPRKLLQKNNATPVLTRPQHRIYHRKHFTEVDIDVHMFSLVARTGINSLVDKTSKMIIDMCFVLQGETEDELPEQILGCARMVRVDLSSAKHLDQVVNVK